MTRAKGSIDVAAPPDVAWNWIVDPEKYLVWNTDFSEYAMLDHKEREVGTTYHMVGMKGGSQIKLDCTVTDWVENERFAFRGETEDGTKAEGTFTIEATEEGCTVSFEEDLELPGAKGRIIGALFLKKAKTQNIEESLQNLKKAIERTHSLSKEG